MTPPGAEGKGRDASPPGPSAVSSLGRLDASRQTEPVVTGAEKTPQDHIGRAAEAPVRPEILRKRADFLRAASARRQGTTSFLLQARQRGDATLALRVGFTCSKKLGNAVMRNRAKRRLREAARAVLPALGRPGWDYVLVGRPGATADRAFEDLLADLRAALLKVHDSPLRPDGPAPPRGKRRGKRRGKGGPVAPVKAAAP